MSSSSILSAIKVRLGQKVKIAVHNLVLLHNRSRHIRHAGYRRRDDVTGAESPVNAGAPALESGVGRRELGRVVLDADQLLSRPAKSFRARV